MLRTDLCNANYACWLVLIYNTLIITNVAKRLNTCMCHIFYYNFSVNFLQSTWILPTKNLPNQDSWGDITCQSPSTKHYHFKRHAYVGQSVLSALSQWHDTYITYTCQKKGTCSKGILFCGMLCVTKHLALTIWHTCTCSNIYWND